jgi:hypothetical protein
VQQFAITHPHQTLHKKIGIVSEHIEVKERKLKYNFLKTYLPWAGAEVDVAGAVVAGWFDGLEVWLLRETSFISTFPSNTLAIIDSEK